jgi:hypothetical protein
MRAVGLAALLLWLSVQEPAPFPPGVMCERPRAGVKVDHPCTCHRVCTETDPEAVIEDPMCLQWCSAEHCACPLEHCT